MTEDEAKQAALALARTLYAPLLPDDEVVLDDSRTQRGAVGWVFWPESRAYLETDNYDASLPRVWAIFVHEGSGRASSIAGDVPTDFEVLGSPPPDWPPRAWLAVPLAAVGQAALWLVAWLALELITRALDIEALPVSVIGAVVLVFIAVWPTAAALRWAKFVNLRRWLPVALTVTGSIVGELALSAYYVSRELSWPDPIAALRLVPEFYAQQSLGYVTIKALAIVLVGAAGWGLLAEKNNSKALWRGD